MSEKKPDIQEEFPEAKHGEIGDVTITEYRKNQIVRLTECFIVSPLCIYAGIRYRKELPKWLSASLVVFGTATLIYNGRNFIVNWRRDGKLIHQAIKQKKEEEKKIRDKIIKGEGGVNKTSEKKQEQSPVVSPPVKKVNPELQKKVVVEPIITTTAKAEVKNEVAKNGSENKKESATITAEKKQSESVIEIVEATIVRPKYDNNIKEVVISEVKSEPQVTTANIVDEKKENTEAVSDKKKEVDTVIEKPITLQQPKKDSADNNGNESKVV